VTAPYIREQRDGLSRDTVLQLNKIFETIAKDIGKAGGPTKAASTFRTPIPGTAAFINDSMVPFIGDIAPKINEKGGVGGPASNPGISSVVTDGITISGDGVNTSIALIEPVLFAVTSTSTTPYAVVATDVFVLASAGAGADIIVNLPASVGPMHGRSRILIFKKMDANPHNVVVTRAGADTIDGGTTATITIQFDMVRLVDGSAGAWSIW
jgi:hypothetical protein